MPVVSTSRYSSSSSTLTGSYRPSLTSSTSLDKSYYRTSSYSTSTLRNSYGDRTEYRSRLSEDGARERKNSLEYSRNSRAPSVTESDSGRYRSERSESRGRDVSTTRSESGKTDRSKRGYISSAALAMSTAELYNKYSPANYIPLTQRLQQQQKQNEICRSKSISNDIGRPPTSDLARARKARNASTISERPEGRRSYKDSSPTPSYSKRNSMTNGVKDTNGNEVPTVSEIRRRFDSKMTVTKLPANDLRYSPKSSVEQYLSQLKDNENGYSKFSKEEKPVPIHLPSERNGVNKWDIGSTSSKSNSNTDLSISKTISEPLSLSKPVTDKYMSASFTAKLPSERLASIKNQLDPNNPIGKILEKSTVIQVENGDYERKRRISPETKKEHVKNDLESQVKAPNHTSNFASYIQISQPVASGSKLDEKNVKQNDFEDIDNDIDSPSATGFENKTFEHENYLKKRTEKSEDKEVDGVKSMETSTESTLSEPDYSPDTSYSRRRILDEDADEKEVSGGRAAVSHSRRSSESEARAERERGESRTPAVSGLNGLRNIGNTCFMNSVLQCLSNTRPLLEYVADDKYNEDINTTLSCMKGALIKAFASVIKELWTVGNRDCVVNTTAFKSQVQRFAPRFMGYSQQDAQEFLRYLLEGLHEDVNRVSVKPKPILTEIDDNLSDCDKAAEAWGRYVRCEESRVGDIFVGQLKSTLRCTHCLHDSVTFDPFWDLSLPLPSRTGTLKLQQCLQHFTKHEELDGDEKPTCSKCGVRRKCLKWLTVQKFPQILVIHLKRFSPTERFRGKLSVVVEFPLAELHMSAYSATAGHATYRLYATSNHSGTTYSGHYTAYCKHPYSGDWYEYNDSRVTPINPRNVVSSEAYLLFYELQPTT